MYESLTTLIPELDSAYEYGTWAVDRKHKGTANDPINVSVKTTA